MNQKVIKMSEVAETNTQKLDFGFFDKIDKNAGYNELIAKDSKGTASDGFFPMSYANTPGTYEFRIYPEAHNDSFRFFREAWIHKLPYKTEEGKRKTHMTIAALGDNRIKELIAEAEEKGLKSKTKGAWKYKASRYGLLMVHMYKAPDNKYVKKGDTGVVLGYKQIDALKGFLDGIEKSGSSLLQFLNPNVANPALSMTVGEDRSTTFSVSGGPLGPISLELPDVMTLPGSHKFEGLDNLYVKQDADTTDEQFEQFKEFLDGEVQEMLEFQASQSTTNNPNEGDGGYTPPAPGGEAPAEGK